MSCDHNCESCSSKCSEDKSLLAEQNANSNIRKVIGVVSGKGGVGKSTVTALCAVMSARLGYRTAIMDADVTGPSIPKMFGIKDKAQGSELGILPGVSKTGIKIISLNLLLEDEGAPVIWRGPVIAGAVKQFWTDVVWEDVDFMFIDMPPGTGDVPLTVFQSIPVDGIIVVTSPQELVGMIVEKAVRMAEMMNIPVLGIVENYSYALCPDCGTKIKLFGDSHIDATCEKFHLPLLGSLPIDPKIAAAADKGMIELFEGDWLDCIAKKLEEIAEK